MSVPSGNAESGGTSSADRLIALERQPLKLPRCVLALGCHRATPKHWWEEAVHTLVVTHDWK